VESSGGWYKKHPDRCFYCEYLQKHPRKQLYKGNSTSQKRLALSERMKLAWKAKKEKLGA
jgi:hypothetical protein